MITCEQDYTAWMVPEQHPTMPGVYERLKDGIVICSMWTGKIWLWSASSPKMASAQAFASDYQRLPWRGLTYQAYLRLGGQ